jgi:dihydroxyacetone kinase DhaKLM complex PTS-EIIA-like component DhaM
MSRQQLVRPLEEVEIMHKLITKKGIIFVAGDYPDKNFKMTKEEVAEAVNKFTGPVALDLNHHTRTIKRLDDRLGKLTSITHDGNGTMFGTVEIPEWLNEIACKDDEGKDLPLPVSCGFAKDKRIVKLALTDTPRVAPAAVFAAFSKAHPDEQIEEEELNLVGGGEISTELSEAVKEAAVNLSPEAMATFAAEFVKKFNEGQSVQPSTFIDSELSGTADDKNTKEINMNSEKVTLLNRMLAFFDSNSADAGTETSTETTETETAAPAVVAPVKEKTSDFSAELAAEKAAREAVETQLKEFKAASLKTQASALASEIISGKHAQESDRTAIEAAFSQALADDEANPAEIQFSADSKGSRVDFLKNVYGSKKVVPLTEETLDETETEVLLSDERPKTNADRIAAVRDRAKALAERESKRMERFAARK